LNAKKSTAEFADIGIPSPPQILLPAIIKKVSTREILVQARKVATSKKPRITVPINIQRILERAIRARNRCAKWFSTMATEYTEEGNAKHVFFIQVLEQAFNILKPAFESRKNLESAKVKAIPRGKLRLSNHFMPLEVDDLQDEEMDNADTKLSASTMKSAGTEQKQPSQLYELEVDSDADLPFVVFCFFEDMHRMLAFIKDTWTKVGTKDLDDMTAALITNLTIEVVQKAEEDLLHAYPHRINKSTSFDNICELIISMPSPTNPSDHDLGMEQNGESEKFGCLSDFVFGSLWLTLSKYSHRSFSHKEYSPWKMVQPMRSDMGKELTPENPDFIEEDELLTQILLDLEFYPPYVEMDKVFEKMNYDEVYRRETVPVKDIITTGLRDFIVTSRISVLAVFAARALLDIRKILGDNSKDSYTTLRQRAADDLEKIKINIQKKENGKDIIECSSIWLEDEFLCQDAYHVTRWIKRVIGEDLLVKNKWIHIQAHPYIWKFHQIYKDGLSELAKEDKIGMGNDIYEDLVKGFKDFDGFCGSSTQDDSEREKSFFRETSPPHDPYRTTIEKVEEEKDDTRILSARPLYQVSYNLRETNSP